MMGILTSEFGMERLYELTARGIFRLARFRETEATDVETNRTAT